MKDRQGFEYHYGPKGYVYQWFPDRDIFKDGRNMRGKFNGLFCSGPAWRRTLHKVLKS